MGSLRRAAHRLTRRGRRRIELVHQVDDPHSHLLVQVLGPLLQAADAELETVVVPAGNPDFISEPQRRRAWSLSDALQIATRYELTLPASEQWPSEEHIALANTIMLVQRPACLQLDVAQATGAALWANDGPALRSLAGQHKAVSSERVAPLLSANAKLLARRGHYHGGMLRYEGEWYWGVDRIHYLEERLRREGLTVAPCLIERADHQPKSAEVGGEPVLDYYHSFRSPYSYLAVDRAVRMAREHDVRLRFKPVLPMVMRGYQVPLAKRLYIVRDAAREARRLAVPFGRICDPVGVGVERCMALFHHASARGKQVELIRSAGRGIWSEALDATDDDDLSHIAQRAGLDWAEAKPQLDSELWRESAEQNRQQLLSLGLWGVPSFRVGNRCAWGQDRLDRVERWLRQHCRQLDAGGCG